MRLWPRGWRWHEILGLVVIGLLVTIVVVLLIAIMTSD
jgi:hypothetical protein